MGCLFFKHHAKRLIPESLLHLYQSRGLVSKAARTIVEAEPEALLIPFLCRSDRPSIDVGAHYGGYAIRMLRHSSQVHIFEPQPMLVKRLAAAFRFQSRVHVHPFGLSDRSGVAGLRIPLRSGQRGTGLATIDPDNRLDEMPTDVVEVAIKRLDEFNIHAPAFIKIDVEGHEEAVLRGGLTMIRRWKPNMLIEAEERHHPQTVKALINVLEPLGYEGFFLQSGVARPIAEFTPKIHQKSAAIAGGYKQRGSYFNNFIFVQNGHLTRRGCSWFARHLA
jgi:FkbM family methyltransferase